MLSSQITSISNNSMSPALRRGSISSSTAVLRSNGSLPRKSRPHNQIRTLRIGLWSSYVEPSLQKEFRRRNRAIKHKYIEAINRKLAWDRQNPGFTRQNGFKGFMCSAWHSQSLKSGGRWVDEEKLDSSRPDAMKNNNSGIEDVELGAFDKLWRKDGFYELLQRRSRAFGYDLTGLNASSDSSNTPTKESAREFSAATVSGAQNFTSSRPISYSTPNANTYLEYEIDPITNRKVFKENTVDDKRKPIDVPVKTFKGYRSQFQDFQPPKSESAERESNDYQPASTSQNDAPKKFDPSRECLQDYEGTDTYKPFFAYEPNGEKPDPVQDGLKDFDTKASYKWTSWLSDEKAATETPAKVCPVQEGLKDYDARTSYEASPSNVPEIKISDLPPDPDPVQQGLRDFDAIAPYGTVKSSDPGPSLTENEIVEGGLRDFDAKTSYGPVLHNEPDGKAPSTQATTVTDDGLREFDNKADYGSRRILKNISLSRGNSMTDRSFRYQNDIDTTEDLDLLRASDVRASSGIIRGSKKESEAERLIKRKELERDFEKPQPFEKMFAGETSTAEKVLEIPRVEVMEQPYQATQTARKLTGNFVRDFPEEFQTSWTASEDASGSLSPKNQTDVWGYDTAPKGLELSYQQEVENDIQRAEKEYIDGRASKESFARNPETPRLQTSLDRSTPQEPEKMDSHKLQAETDPYSKTPQGLETSYAEECKLQTEVDPYSKEPQGLQTSYKDECAAQQGEGDLSATVSAYGAQKDEQAQRLDIASRSQKLQREVERLEKDTNQRKQEVGLVNELRTIIKEEHLDPPKETFQSLLADYAQPAPPLKAVGSRFKEKDGQVTPPAVKAQEPTVYKILAYDPTMQSISTAETTSIVTDSAAALTPAEVLLRLSNPAKFFPHFQPLQEQGYEIVSGSGDVLVFRKVRVVGPSGTKSDSSSSYEERTRKTTNPIDGMRPIAATGNFASPTGFVNYDRPDSPEPPFKSNIDVRREEPVFSGKSSWTEDAEKTQRKKPSLGKRVFLGGAMVGGCSYAIGVVAEYFKSGGIDGLGPQTF